MKLGNVTASICALGALLVVTESAFAREVLLPPESNTRIGMIAERDASGRITAIRAWAGSLVNGACSWAHLGTNGLTENTTLRGSAQRETVIAVTSTTQWCGQTFAPLVTNGRRCTLLGEGGNDTLSGASACDVNGGAGNDLVVSNRLRGLVEGGSGDDTVASSYVTFLAGQNGNDVLCAYGSRIVEQADGGINGGFDVLCGLPKVYLNTEQEFFFFEGASCLVCG